MIAGRLRGQHRSARTTSTVVGTVVALTLTTLATVTGVGAVAGSSSASAATSALACDQNTIYAIDASGRLESIIPATGAATLVKSVAPATNALGITDNGIDAYAYDGPGRKITKYDPATGQPTTTSTGDTAAPTAIIRGAVNPKTGIYYYGGSGTSSYVGAYDTNTDKEIGQVGTITGLLNQNGDFAFSNQGVLFVVSGNEVLRVNAATMPTTAGNQTLPASLVATLPSGTNSPGIAFSSDGYLYVSNGSTLLKLDPASGVQQGAAISITPSYTPTDLASCNYPNTITVQKNVVGRVNATDEFGLSVTGGGITSGNTATTAGSATGIQTQVAGAALVTPAKTYTIAETAAGGANLANYVSTYSCVNTNTNTSVATGSGSTGTFVFPAATTPAGTDTTCTFTNTPKTATINLTKALGGARSDSSDQFTVAVRSVSATGAVLNSTTKSTTTGTGATVTAGSGTTGVTSDVVTRPVFLTEALAAGSKSVAAQYTATITCADANGLQTGLPTNATFSGSLAITPVANAAISCTLTNTPVPPTLLVKTVLGSNRYSATDQFTEAIHTGGSSGPVVNSTTSSLTTGTGSTVGAGSGTTGTYTGSNGTTYTVTDGFTADSTKYATTITCVDANGHQTGLPTNAPFTGALDITPVAGAAITCTLTQSTTPVSLSLTKTGPTTMTVGAVSTYQLTVTNNGGSAGPSHLVDQLPPNIAYVSASGAGWTCTATGPVSAGQVVTCDGPTIGAGGSAVLTINVRPTAAAAGTNVVNRAAVDPTGGKNPVNPSTCTGNGTPPGCAIAPSALVVTPVLVLKKIATPVAPATAPLEAGDQIEYTFLVTNNSQVAIDNLTVTDALAGLVTCPVTTLAPGASTTCTATKKYTVTAADVTAGQVDNTATASGTLPGCTGSIGSATCPTVPSNPSSTETLTVSAPTISLTKALGSARYAAGDQFTVAIRTGSATGPVVNSATKSTTTGTGASVGSGTGTTGVYQATTGTAYFLTESASADAAKYSAAISCTDASGHQTGLPAAGTAFNGSLLITPVKGAAISCTLTNTALPASLALTKSSPSTLVIGAVSSYTLNVTNGGGQPAPGRVLDALPPNLAFVSAAGNGWACTASGTVAAGPVLVCAGPTIAAGGSSSFTVSVRPTASASGTVINKASVDPTGGTTPPNPAGCTGNNTPAGCAVAPGVLVSSPVLVLKKIATPVAPATTPLEAGDQIEYTFLVTNNSQVAIDNLTVTDALAGLVTCPVTTLAPGASTTCTATKKYTVTAADVTAGQVDNTATASGTLPGCTGAVGSATCPTVPSNPSTTDTFTVGPPTISLNTVFGSDRYNDGDQFTVGISAGGNPVLVPVNATTSGTGSAVTTGTGTTGTYVATTGTTYDLTDVANHNGAQYTAKVTCVDANGLQTGLPTNATYTGSLSITPVKGSAIACTVTETAVPAHLTLTKTGPSTMTVGAVTSYTLVVTNSGGQAGGTTVADKLPANIQFVSAAGTGWTCAASGAASTGQTLTCTGPSIAVTASSTLTVSVIPLSEAAGKSVVNKAAVDTTGGTAPVDPSTCTGTGQPSAGCAIAPSVMVLTPELDLVKKATPISPATSPVKQGDQIQYTFVVSNASQVPVDNIEVTDAKAGTISCPVTTLAPGASTTCEAAPYTVTSADVAAGSVDNTATAAATLPGCRGARGGDTCPVVTSDPSSTKTPTAKPAGLASTGSDVAAYLLVGAGALLLGLGLVVFASTARRRRLS